MTEDRISSAEYERIKRAYKKLTRRIDDYIQAVNYEDATTIAKKSAAVHKSYLSFAALQVEVHENTSWPLPVEPRRSEKPSAFAVLQRVDYELTSNGVFEGAQLASSEQLGYLIYAATHGRGWAALDEKYPSIVKRGEFSVIAERSSLIAEDIEPAGWTLAPLIRVGKVLYEFAEFQ